MQVEKSKEFQTKSQGKSDSPLFKQSSDKNADLIQNLCNFEETNLSLSKVAKNIVSKIRDEQSSTQEIRKLGSWTREEQLQYHYGVLKFVLQNPHCDISWKYRKPDGFNIFIEKHLIQIFKDQTKKYHVKTKDQNLKEKYFIKSSKHRDLLRLCQDRLEEYIRILKAKKQEEKMLSECQLQRLTRFDDLLKSFRQFKNKGVEKLQYEILLDDVLDYNRKHQSLFDRLSKMI